MHISSKDKIIKLLVNISCKTYAKGKRKNELKVRFCSTFLRLAKRVKPALVSRVYDVTQLSISTVQFWLSSG